MGISVLIRVGSGFLVVILLARSLGPTSFGTIATILAVATIASLLTDFGFAQKTLRDIAIDRANGATIFNKSFNIKLILTVLCCGISAPFFYLVPPDARHPSAILFLAILIGSVGDLSMTAFRSIGRFEREAWITMWSSIAHVLIIGGTAYATRDIKILSYAYLFSRIIYSTAAVSQSYRILNANFQLIEYRDALSEIKYASKWAIDSGLSFISMQIDTILVALLLGTFDAGLYQTVARFYQTSLSLIGVLVSVHVPKLSVLVADRSPVLAKAQRWVMVEFTLVGSIIGLAFWLAGPIAVPIIFGEAYRSANAMWPGMAFAVFIRMAISGLGTVLVSKNMPAARAWGQAAGILAFSAFMLSFVGKGQLALVPWAMASTSLLTLLIYLGALSPLSRRTSPIDLSRKP